MTSKRISDIKWVAAFAGLGFILSVPAAAQSGVTQSASAPQTKSAPPASTASLPSVDQILNHYIEASGGHDAWKKLSTRVSKGTIDIPAMNMSGTIEVREKAPNEMIATVVIGGGSFQQAYDGKTAWANDPQNGLRELSGGELDETRRDSDFYRPLDMKALYNKITVVGTEKVGDRDTYLVEATTEVGVDPEKMYFDAQTGLPIRVISQRHTPDGVTASQEDISDYREVDGVKLPFTVHQSVGDVAYTISFTEIHHNEEMDDAQFAKPASQ